MILGWKTFSNLENSLYEYLQEIITDDNLQVLDSDGNALPINVKIGYSFDSNDKLPSICIYEDSRLSPRGFIGSNKRIYTYLMIIDIRGLNDLQRSDISLWFEETINAGFPYIEYTISGDPDNPDKLDVGHVAIEFLTNTPIRGGDGVDLFEKYRQRISISCFIEQTI